MYRFIIKLSYCGLNFYGLAKQTDESLPTIQGIIENAIKNFNIKFTSLRFISRTDKNVSAYEQYLFIESENNGIFEKFKYIQKIVENVSDRHIMLHSIKETKQERPKVVKKTYTYKLTNVKNASIRNTHYFVENFTQKEIELFCSYIEKINNKRLDYSIFCKHKKTNIRPEIQQLTTSYSINNIRDQHKEIVVTISGECFMYRQIRMLIGGFVKFAKMNIAVNNIEEFMQNQKNEIYINTAPGEALCLTSIHLDIN